MNSDLKRIEEELNEADIPKQVWIGTDSTADRVTWLITRNKLNQQNSRARHKMLERLGAETQIIHLLEKQHDEWLTLTDVCDSLGTFMEDRVNRALNYLADVEVIERQSRSDGDAFRIQEGA